MRSIHLISVLCIITFIFLLKTMSNLTFEYSMNPDLQQLESNLTSKCTYISIFPNTKYKLSPSDLYWNSLRGELVVVSDNGHVFTMDLDGRIQSHFKLGKEYDLEAVTMMDDDSETVYLGLEHPPSIIEFSLKSQKILHQWKLDEMRMVPLEPSAKLQHDSMTNSGLESMVYHRGLFYVGRQADSKIFIYALDKSSRMMNYRGQIQPDGPGYDLSAMTIWDNRVWLLFDKPKALYEYKLDDFYPSHLVVSGGPVSFTVSSINSFEMELRGGEGIAFAPVKGETSILIAIDPPKSKGPKNIVKYSSYSALKCFNHFKK